MLTKTNIIDEFKNKCLGSDEEEIKSRIFLFQNQYYKAEFEEYPQIGLVRVGETKNEFWIKLFPKIDNEFDLNEELIFGLTGQEFNDLKKVFLNKKETQC